MSGGSSKFGSPHIQSLRGDDAIVVAERLVELAHSSPFTVERDNGSGEFLIFVDNATGKKACSPVVDPLDAAHVVQELFLAIRTMAGDIGNINLESCVRAHLRQVLLEADDLPTPVQLPQCSLQQPGQALAASQRSDGNGHHDESSPLSRCPPVSSRLRRKSQQAGPPDSAAGGGHSVDVNTGGSSLLIQSTATSSTNPLVDEFFDSMVLPSVARIALQSSTHIPADGEGASAGSGPAFLRDLRPPPVVSMTEGTATTEDAFIVTQPVLHSEPEVDSPLLHQQRAKPWPTFDEAQRRDERKTQSEGRAVAAVAAASITSTGGSIGKANGSVNRRSDSDEQNAARRWMKMPTPKSTLPPPKLLGVTAQQLPADDIPASSDFFLFGLLLLHRAAQR